MISAFGLPQLSFVRSKSQNPIRLFEMPSAKKPRDYGRALVETKPRCFLR